MSSQVTKYFFQTEKEIKGPLTLAEFQKLRMEASTIKQCKRLLWDIEFLGIQKYWEWKAEHEKAL